MGFARFEKSRMAEWKIASNNRGQSCCAIQNCSIVQGIQETQPDCACAQTGLCVRNRRGKRGMLGAPPAASTAVGHSERAPTARRQYRASGSGKTVPGARKPAGRTMDKIASRGQASGLSRRQSCRAGKQAGVHSTWDHLGESGSGGKVGPRATKSATSAKDRRLAGQTNKMVIWLRS